MHSLWLVIASGVKVVEEKGANSCRILNSCLRKVFMSLYWIIPMHYVLAWTATEIERSRHPTGQAFVSYLKCVWSSKPKQLDDRTQKGVRIISIVE